MKMILKYLVALLVLWQISVAQAHEAVPIELEGIGITEHLGDTIDLNLPFVDESGQAVTLKKYFDGVHPVILTLVYYECPNLCHFLLNGFTDSLNQLAWSAGEQFNIVTVSIDPKEKYLLAGPKKKSHLEIYQRATAANGWHFLTGQEKNIQPLAAQVGFGYRYDADEKQYAHPAAIFILTPTGKISRVLYGITFNPRDLKLALLEATEGKIGTAVDKFLLFCYHYDPKGRKYALFATNLMKGAGAVTVFAVGSLLLFGKKKRDHV